VPFNSGWATCMHRLTAARARACPPCPCRVCPRLDCTP
jgi:hypothetical protein